ncbi:hypothetical protein DEO72_LG6g1282 [Vigna unguiculata]|uniref:Uncharacterized protein n=1 Tax=Vigna unguiculata TaxID=3917 RepID=A0A4D6M8X5_VIGUN|nr:hypothetical protein DEO72_LG6g1282 [Vigna unguiculata]
MAAASARVVTGDVCFAIWWFVWATWFRNADNLWFGFCKSRFVLQFLILVSSSGKGFVAVVASSRDGGGDSHSGAMCSVLHTRISHLHFTGFVFLQVVHTIPGDFGYVFTVVANMVVANFDDGVTMMEGTGGTMLLYGFGSRDSRQKNESMASVLKTRGQKSPLLTSPQYASVLEPR